MYSADQVSTLLLLALAMSLTLPDSLSYLVHDREEKYLDIMAVNGLDKSAYLANFLLSHGVVAVASMLLTLLLMVQLLEGNALVTRSSRLVLLFILLLWTIFQMAIAIILSRFIQSTKLASLTGYLVSVWNVVIATPINSLVYPYPNQVPPVFYFNPGFLFIRTLYRLTFLALDDHPVQTFAHLFEDSQLSHCVLSLLLWTTLAVLISFWLHLSDSAEKTPKSTEYLEFEEERDQQVLKCENVGFSYSPGTIALSQVSFQVSNDQIFGLLGPNGAGKSTLFSLLSGSKTPSQGKVFVQGQEISRSKSVSIGVCPQFDVLWKQLTVKQHLQFYYQLKTGSIDQSDMTRVIEIVRLGQFVDLRVKELSGGMRRRLSIAVACIGRPSVLLLDEPSTGLDPDNKHALWQIIKDCRDGKVVVLTTHSMEQADKLCSRVGLLVGGKLKFIGRQNQLKKIFGGGLVLTVCFKERASLPLVIADFEQRFVGCCTTEVFEKSAQFQLREGARLSEVIKGVRGAMEDAGLGLLQWRVSQPSFEQAYIRAMARFSQHQDQ